MPGSLGRWNLPAATGAAAAIGGAAAAWHYHAAGLTLTHYDARGHLVVARRIVDSVTPGWQQIGAVWLPLPHLINALPVQIDVLYRTGASAVAISVAAFAVSVAAITWIVREITGSRVPALAAATVFALNPNVLYLQSTPMTEPLLLATITAAVAMLMHWTARDAASAGAKPAAVGSAFALACLTRYEAWPVTFGAVIAALVVRWRRGDQFRVAARQVGAIALYPLAAILAFSVFSRVVIGQWFVSSDFFVPENKAIGNAEVAAREIGWGLSTLSGNALTWIAGIGLMIGLARAAIALLNRSASRFALFVIPAALATTAAIPWAAFYRGHPFRIRYVVPLIAIEAIGAAVAAGLMPGRKAQTAAIAALLAVAAFELRPLDATAPMVVEAQWDRPNLPERARVTACIGRLEPGAKIMASMGSLGHYMQEASESGLDVRDFLHEGNGDIWLAALDRPQPFADWILIEEKAEGGDMLARIARERPSFLAGYQRTCEGAGMALYRRVGNQDAPLKVNAERDRVVPPAEIDPRNR